MHIINLAKALIATIDTTSNAAKDFEIKFSSLRNYVRIGNGLTFSSYLVL